MHGVCYGHHGVKHGDGKGACVNAAGLPEEAPGDNRSDGDEEDQGEQINKAHGVEGEYTCADQCAVLDEDNHCDAKNVADTAQQKLSPLRTAFDPVAAVDK